MNGKREFARVTIALLAAALGLAVTAAGAGAQALVANPPPVAEKARTVFTASQMAEVRQRWELAQGIVARLEPEARSMGLVEAWKQTTLGNLLQHPSGRLLEIARAGGYQATIAASEKAAKVAAKNLGDPSVDLVYVPFAPCRFVDTRIVGGKIMPSRAFDNSQNGQTYGGSAGCSPVVAAGVTTDDQIAALAMDIAVVDTSTAGVGYLGARPYGSSVVTALLNWYVAGPSVAVANQAIVTMDQTANVYEWELFTSGPVYAVVDLFGAFVAPKATPLQCTWINSSVTMTVAGSYYTTTATCAAGSTLMGGGCFFSTVQSNQHLIADSLKNTIPTPTYDTWICGGTSSIANDQLWVQANCCRVPGR